MTFDRRAVRVAVAAAVGLGVASPTLADGFIVIDRLPEFISRHPDLVASRRVWMPMEVRYHHVSSVIRDRVGVTRVDQVFHNPNAEPMEGTYLFPLPESAWVQKFSMWMDGKEVRGEILDAEKARALYEDIVRKMKDPALLEYVGGRAYRARVFPIPGRGDVKIALEYSETLDVADGLVTYRYPLNTEKFSAREIDDVTVVVEIRSEVPLKDVFCPSHPAEVLRPDEHRARVAFEARHVRPDSDFVVHWQTTQKEFGLSLLSYKPVAEDGFFLARIAPPVSVSDSQIEPKDVCFVFDISGSMAGEKLQQARRALGFCLSSLRPGDRFNMIFFATEARKFRDALVPASPENVEAAKAEVTRAEAAGGTNIHEALMLAIGAASPRAGGDRPYVVIFVTDGEPTVGERDPEKIWASVRRANDGRCRLFVFGVGHDLNVKLLDRLAEENRGAREYVEEKEDIEVKVSSFFRRVSRPILSNLEVRFGEAGAGEIYPKTLPDLFHGSEIVLVGRYRNPGRHTVTIRGRRAGRELVWEYPARFAESQTDSDFLPRLWATRKIGFLMDEIRLHGETKALKDEIVRLAKRYAVVTPYTSYLVVEEGKQRELVRNEPALEVLGRYSRSERMKDLPVLGWKYTQAASGQAAVKGSREARMLQEMSFAASTAVPPGLVADDAGTTVSSGGASEPIRTVGAKTFYLQDGVWIDSEHDAERPIRKVRAFSEEYFSLVRRQPDLARYLAIGPRVVVVVGKTAYEITE